MTTASEVMKSLFPTMDVAVGDGPSLTVDVSVATSAAGVCDAEDDCGGDSDGDSGDGSDSGDDSDGTVWVMTSARVYWSM